MNSEKFLRLGHIGLNVTELEKSRHFYERVLGLKVMHESHEAERHFLFLGDGAQILLTLWQQSEGTFSTTNPGLHHLAFEVDSMHEVEAFQHKLRGLNVTFEHSSIVPHGEGLDSGGIYFYDPDGIRLEIYSPTGAREFQAPHPGTSSCGFF